MASKNIPPNGWPQLKDLEAVQPTLDRLDKIEAWKRTVKEETFTGEELTIPNALKLPARSLKTTIEAIQDLHGLPFPYVGGAYKNKLITPDLATLKSLNTGGTWSDNEYTFRGVTYTVITDNDGNVTGINANGTATDGLSDFFFTTTTRKTLDNYGLVVGNSYIFTSGLASDVSGVIMMLNGAASNIEASASGRTFTVNSTDMYSINIRVYTNTTANNVLFKPMFRLSTESDASFAPYSNICPISGRTEARVDDTGKNKVETPSATAFAARGITLTTASNGETILNGTSTAGSIDGDTFELPAGTYTISVGTTLPSGIWISLDGVGGAMISPTGKSISFTTTEAKSTFTHIYVNAGVAFNNFKLNWMLEEGNTATAYEPYAHSSATIQLGTTVYGADINWDTGVATVNSVNVDMSTLNWTRDTNIDGMFYGDIPNATDCTSVNIPPDFLVSCYKPMPSGYSGTYPDSDNIAYRGTSSTLRIIRVIDKRFTTVNELRTALSGQTVCYKLATPTTLQLTPTQLQMLKGYNHITLADGYGTIELKALTGANWS